MLRLIYISSQLSYERISSLVMDRSMHFKTISYIFSSKLICAKFWCFITYFILKFSDKCIMVGFKYLQSTFWFFTMGLRPYSRGKKHTSINIEFFLAVKAGKSMSQTNLNGVYHWLRTLTLRNNASIRVCLVVRRKWEERNRWERVWRTKYHIYVLKLLFADSQLPHKI